ncbi:MAG: cell division protein FtsQ/DivIB [Acidobacteriota bacterium]
MAREQAEEHSRQEQDDTVHGRRVYAASVLIGILCASIAIGAVQWKKALMVHALAVEGERIVTRDEVIRLSGVTSQHALFGVNLARLQSMLESNPFIRHARVQREAPSSIRVSITEREPAAILVLNGRSEQLYVDEEGCLLPCIMSQAIYDLPVITGVDSAQMFKPGMRTTNADILAALEIVKAAKAVSLEVSHLVSEVRVRNGHDIVLYAFDGGTPILFGQGDAVKKMAVLDAFWKKFMVEGNARELEYIDLRYDGQVVTLPKQQAAAAQF